MVRLRSLTVGAGQFLGTVKATDLGGFRDTSVGAPAGASAMHQIGIGM